MGRMPHRFACGRIAQTGRQTESAVGNFNNKEGR